MEKRWIFIFLEILFNLLIIFIGVNLALNVDLTKSINLKGETNDFCQTLNKSETKGPLDYLACDNKFKKDKIILLLIDSLPFDELRILTDGEKSRITNFFRGKGVDYKQSGALFETILIGKFSRNYAATNMGYDSIARQFKNANMNVFYKLRTFPMYLSNFSIVFLDIACFIALASSIAFSLSTSKTSTFLTPSLVYATTTWFFENSSAVMFSG